MRAHTSALSRTRSIGICGSMSLQPKNMGVPSKRPLSSQVVPGGPIAPPLNAANPPKRDAFRIANSVVRHAPCENPIMTIRLRVIPDASRSVTSDLSTDSADDKYGSFLVISVRKLYGYHVLFA